MPLLTVKNLSIQFQSRDTTFEAVKNISFSLNEGEILGIVGESGSGKSVTCQSLTGLLPCPPATVKADSLLFDGHELLAASEKELRRHRGSSISFIFQDPMTSLNPYMTIGAQLTETLRAHTPISRSLAKEKAIEALEEVGIRDASARINAYPHEFSGGMRQRAMIAMALITNPKLLIADEPTTAIDVTVQAQILEILKNLQKTRELSVIFITHDLGVVSNIANNIIVMKKGEIVEQGSTQEVLQSPSAQYTKDLIGSIPSGPKPDQHRYIEGDGDLLKVENIHKSFVKQQSKLFFWKKASSLSVLKDVSLTIKKGEIVGLVGESGSGKSTLGRIIIKLLDHDSGTISFDGQHLDNQASQMPLPLRSEIQMIFQDPYASLNPRKAVYQILKEPLELHGIAQGDACLDRIYQLLDEVGLAKEDIYKYPHQFSGGQRQRIAIARALAIEPQLIIADEPVSALDVTIQAQILELLLQITRKKNLALLFISHDLSVVRYLCDRTLVMEKGVIVEQGGSEHVFNSPSHPYTQKLIQAVPTLQA